MKRNLLTALFAFLYMFVWVSLLGGSQQADGLGYLCLIVVLVLGFVLGLSLALWDAQRNPDKFGGLIGLFVGGVMGMVIQATLMNLFLPQWTVFS